MTTATTTPKYTTFSVRFNSLTGNYIVFAKNPETGAAWCNSGYYVIRTAEEAEATILDLKSEQVA